MGNHPTRTKSTTAPRRKPGDRKTRSIRLPSAPPSTNDSATTSTGVVRAPDGTDRAERDHARDHRQDRREPLEQAERAAGVAAEPEARRRRRRWRSAPSESSTNRPDLRELIERPGRRRRSRAAMPRLRRRVCRLSASLAHAPCSRRSARPTGSPRAAPGRCDARRARTPRRSCSRFVRARGRSRRRSGAPTPESRRSRSRSTLTVSPSPDSSSNCVSPRSRSIASASASAASSSACWRCRSRSSTSSRRSRSTVLGARLGRSRFTSNPDSGQMTVLDRRTFFAGSGFAGSGFAGSGFAGPGFAGPASPFWLRRGPSPRRPSRRRGSPAPSWRWPGSARCAPWAPACRHLSWPAPPSSPGPSSPAPASSRTPPSSREPSSRETPSSPAPPSSRASPVWMASSSLPRPGCCSSPASRARPPSSPPWVRVRLSPSSSQVRPSTWTFPRGASAGL